MGGAGAESEVTSYNEPTPSGSPLWQHSVHVGHVVSHQQPRRGGRRVVSAGASPRALRPPEDAPGTPISLGPGHIPSLSLGQLDRPTFKRYEIFYIASQLIFVSDVTFLVTDANLG